MIAFYADTNAILVRPFPSKHYAHCIAAYRDIHSHLSNANRMKPMVHILDNEASLAFRQAITSNGSTYQLVPHMSIIAMLLNAPRTFKDHFLAVLAGTAPSFPADRWDLLFLMPNSTLNLLRTSRCNPTLSAWEDLFGRSTLMPHQWDRQVCRVLIHSKATTCHRGTIAAMNGSTLVQHFTTIAATSP
eukprot:CCRYP_015693-RA/>CCRYP_015693-RA protein AED:0.40 eAED:0.40 QI:0/-1/0/1/-1/1/1/0/187